GGLGVAVLLAGRLEIADAPPRVEEGVARREGAGNDQAHLLAEGFERLGHGEHRAESVAVGANVGRHQEASVATDEIDKPRPVDRHGGFSAGRNVNTNYTTGAAQGKRSLTCFAAGRGGRETPDISGRILTRSDGMIARLPTSHPFPSSCTV